jgi:hypothetical protein
VSRHELAWHYLRTGDKERAFPARARGRTAKPARRECRGIAGECRRCRTPGSRGSGSGPRGHRPRRLGGGAADRGGAATARSAAGGGGYGSGCRTRAIISWSLVVWAARRARTASVGEAGYNQPRPTRTEGRSPAWRQRLMVCGLAHSRSHTSRPTWKRGRVGGSRTAALDTERIDQYPSLSIYLGRG